MGPRCPVPGPKTVRRAVSNPQAEAVEEIITTTHPQTRRPVDGVVSASRSWAMGLAPQPAFSSWSNSWPIRPHNRPVWPFRPKVWPFRPKVWPFRPKVWPLQPKVLPPQPKVLPLQPKVLPLQPKVWPLRPKVLPLQPKVLPLQPKVFAKKYGFFSSCGRGGRRAPSGLPPLRTRRGSRKTGTRGFLWPLIGRMLCPRICWRR